jgi:hypothetical protein
LGVFTHQLIILIIHIRRNSSHRENNSAAADETNPLQQGIRFLDAQNGTAICKNCNSLAAIRIFFWKNQ